MLGPRVGGEGMGRGNSESITANTITSRHTNATETNQSSAFDVHRTEEASMYPHV